MSRFDTENKDVSGREPRRSPAFTALFRLVAEVARLPGGGQDRKFGDFRYTNLKSAIGGIRPDAG